MSVESIHLLTLIRAEKFDTCNALLLSFWGRGPGPPDSPASKFGSFLQFVTPYPRVGNSFLGFTGSEGCSPEIVPFEQRRKAGLIWGKKPSQFA